MRNSLFKQIRWRLALWYAGMMGGILGLCGLGVYEAIVHAHQVTIDQEIKSVAGTLHDSLEPVLKQPGTLDSAVTRLLPDLCLVKNPCFHPFSTQRHAVGAIAQGKYYTRLYNLSGRLIAVAGLSTPNLPFIPTQQQLINIQDNTGQNYRQISFILHTQNYQDWGYLQVGRSLDDVENYIGRVQVILILGLPLAMLLIAIASWWLVRLAMQPIYQSYQQIQQFTADAAHELRTPLAAIRATLESVLMLPKLSENEAKETLETLLRQNLRLSTLVSDLLMLSRIDQQFSRQEALVTAPVCLNDIINDISEEFAALAISASITLKTEINNANLIKIPGNTDQLYRLVANLIANAIQYTHTGGEVILRLKKINNLALIEIQDTGIAIAPENQKKIFDRFYRVNSDRARISGGFGLGLSICKAIAQAHNGTIEVKSEIGKGSIFTLKLPIKDV